eukprot:CAMPEP_0197287694 /NCGR_PEP_ID=MMETSP0890-20130614/4309_1 /TAXON_ID=44058 ORGANISM="Aureoumbra lagunensis, Strain CCMP1510" /NCGR_SAMPLE_ID=MMETSP0890 /ASSEMBLY_ACC=CAM_ASM_000533 /LENGTH=84 /DNA_ID=CAMNT_0042757667 /DNA_START=756 /DNA_END=1010 /DNA_ORIENTATION=-
MMAFGAVWIMNNLAAQLVATGAFEIYVDDNLVFSKLETGRLPTASDIVKNFATVGLHVRTAAQRAALHATETVNNDLLPGADGY